MEETINNQFKKEFGDFDYPFKTSDQKLAKMHESDRLAYYKEAKSIRNSSVIVQEINEITRILYQKLSLEEEKPERMMYKGALLFLNRFKGRINELAKNYKTDQEIVEEQSRIDKIIPE